MLRAIHFLLAFRWFVVILAVHARWRKRALEDRFSLMLTEQTMPPEHIAWRGTASPDDELEKIFQVLFWIRPLGRSGSGGLVTELTRHDVDLSQVPAVVPNGSAPSNAGEAGKPEGERSDMENRGNASNGGAWIGRETGSGASRFRFGQAEGRRGFFSEDVGVEHKLQPVAQVHT